LHKLRGELGMLGWEALACNPCPLIRSLGKAGLLGVSQTAAGQHPWLSAHQHHTCQASPSMGSTRTVWDRTLGWTAAALHEGPKRLCKLKLGSLRPNHLLQVVA
jgi:hypothetical protein